MPDPIIALASMVFVTLIISIFLLFRIVKFNPKNFELTMKRLLKENKDELDKTIKDEFSRNRDEFSKSSRSQREEMDTSLNKFADQLFGRMTDISKMQKGQLDIFSERLSKLTETNEKKFDNLRDKVEHQLKELQSNNEKKLEEMRVTVDEKLQSTLEKRLGDSFKLVSERLELVHKGLGEMQTLASGVGDLKKVLSNVKTRGTWGEVQLGNLIEQILTADQYAKNVCTKKGSRDAVEFAIKLPGRDGIGEEAVWLPIDAKFPLEDYHRLLEAQENADVPLIEDAIKSLESCIKREAKNISSKYLDPPNTTDFAIMFLPVEGLYAEVIRRTGLVEIIQREFRITVAGPTNIAAILNSLQMGFRTLAIEKSSSEVWSLLGQVKADFGRFGEVLDKTKKKLQEASNTIDRASTASRRIERRLKDVQELPVDETPDLIEVKNDEENTED